MNPLLLLILPPGGLIKEGSLSTQNCIIQSLAALPSLHSFTESPEPAAAELRQLHERMQRSESVDPKRLSDLLGVEDIEEGEGALPYIFLLSMVDALPVLAKMTCSSTLVRGVYHPPKPVHWLTPTKPERLESLLAKSQIRFSSLPEILILGFNKFAVSTHLPYTVLFKPLAIECPMTLTVSSTASQIYATKCYDLCATVQDHPFCKHSVAHIRQARSKLWYRAHNQNISLLKQKEVIDPSTWLLFYQSRKRD